jgi:hypothetical protein
MNGQLERRDPCSGGKTGEKQAQGITKMVDYIHFGTVKEYNSNINNYTL